MLKNNKKAFTLAEVLLTLAIIGIVAAITIPSLMQNVQDMDTVAKLKKTHSTLQQVVKMYIAQNLVTDLATANIFAGSTMPAWNAFKPYLILSKDCGNTIGKGCFAPGYVYKTLDESSGMEIDDNLCNTGMLTDGSSIQFCGQSYCNRNYSSTYSGPLYQSSCGNFDIDINGRKAPNTYGRDVFRFIMVKDGTIYPGGALDDFNGCNKDGDMNEKTGYGCAAKVLKDGKINY